MSTFTLAISCLSTSNFPWFTDLTFQVPMHYCSLSIRPCFYHQSHPQLGIVFALAPSPHSFWSYFSTDLWWHIGHLLIWGVHLSVFHLFAFSYCSWGPQGKNTEVVCHPLLQWTIFCQIWPWNMELSRAKANRVLPGDRTGHSKHHLPTTQEKTLYMDITRWSTPKSDWLYSSQPKMEKLYTVSKNKTGSLLWLRSWTPYCQIQTEIEESRENH